MIDTFILIGVGWAAVVLAILAIAFIRRNSRLEREKKAARQDAEGAQRELEVAIAGKEALKAENGRLQQELHYTQQQNIELEARHSALVKAMEARPTLPKRAVRKNSTPQEEA